MTSSFKSWLVAQWRVGGPGSTPGRRIMASALAVMGTLSVSNTMHEMPSPQASPIEKWNVFVISTRIGGSTTFRPIKNICWFIPTKFVSCIICVVMRSDYYVTFGCGQLIWNWPIDSSTSCELGWSFVLVYFKRDIIDFSGIASTHTNCFGFLIRSGYSWFNYPLKLFSFIEKKKEVNMRIGWRQSGMSYLFCLV